LALLTKYYSDKQIKKNEMGGAFSTMGERRGAYRWGNLRQGDHLEDPQVDGRMILK
jgi:hypothetical protein